MSDKPDATRSLRQYGSDQDALGARTAALGWRVLLRLLRYLRPYSGRFALMAGLTIGASMLKISAILFIKPFVEIMDKTFTVEGYADVPLLGSGLGREWLQAFADLLAAEPRMALLVLIGALTGLIIAQALMGLGATYLQGYVGGRVGMDVQRDVVDHLMAQPVSFFSERGKGELVRVANVDSFILYRVMHVVFDRFVKGGVEAGIALGLALILNWHLALVGVATVVPVAALLSEFGRQMRKRERSGFHFQGVSGVVLQELVAAPRVIKAYLLEKYFSDRLAWARAKVFRRYLALTKMRAWTLPAVEGIVAVVLGVFVYYHGVAIIEDRLQPADFLLPYACLAMLLNPLRKAARGYGEFVVTTQSAYRVFDLLGREPGVKDRPDAIDLPPVAGAIEFRDVRFSYREDRPALNGVSFHIEPGERVALVGRSGAGKSTVAALLMRLYDVNGGEIRIDGHDIAAVRQLSLRSQVGLVPQETMIFSDTVRMNIACGANPDQAAVETAAKAARAHDFIMELPRGYDTDLGDMGTDLSGGQRQRLAVARCLFRNTPVLVLDEATSSLDAVTEAEMQEEIQLMTAGRTTIIIAHRFSTILNADRIIFLEEGEVRGTGTHRELYADNALYRELLTHQALTVDDLQSSGAPSPAA